MIIIHQCIQQLKVSESGAIEYKQSVNEDFPIIPNEWHFNELTLYKAENYLQIYSR